MIKQINSVCIRTNIFKDLFCRPCSTLTKKNDSKIVFSGIQPTGTIHLGNYIGAIAPWVRLQEPGQNYKNIILSVVDLHSMTLNFDHKSINQKVLEITATLLGCGIDPNKVILFQQSSVPMHTELYWYLGCISTMARLSHLPQFKEKSKLVKDVPLGLFVYPVLQAADILLYKATDVPTGEDQVQHIQLTQELARMSNNRFGTTFPIPRAVISGAEFSRLRSLRDPSKKMSKSDPDPKSRICLMDKPDDIVKIIKKAVTDFKSEVTYNIEERPGVTNLINIHSFVTNKTAQQICEEAVNLNTGQYKLLVADAVISYIKPIQERIANYIAEPQYLTSVLLEGSEKATEIASVTLDEVKSKLGVLPKIQRERSKLNA